MSSQPHESLCRVLLSSFMKWDSIEESECVSTSQDKLWARSRKNLLEKGLDLLPVPCAEPIMGCSPPGTTMLGYGRSLSSVSKGNFLRKCLLATRPFNEAPCKDLTEAQKPFLQSPPGNHLSMRCW